MNMSNIYGIVAKTSSLQNRVSKFMPKKFYEIDLWTKRGLVVQPCLPNSRAMAVSAEHSVGQRPHQQSVFRPKDVIRRQDTSHNDIQHNGIKHSNKSNETLRTMKERCYAECH